MVPQGCCLRCTRSLLGRNFNVFVLWGVIWLIFRKACSLSLSLWPLLRRKGYRELSADGGGHGAAPDQLRWQPGLQGRPRRRGVCFRGGAAGLLTDPSGDEGGCLPGLGTLPAPHGGTGTPHRGAEPGLALEDIPGSGRRPRGLPRGSARGPSGSGPRQIGAGLGHPRVSGRPPGPARTCWHRSQAPSRERVSRRWFSIPAEG